MEFLASLLTWRMPAGGARGEPERCGSFLFMNDVPGSATTTDAQPICHFSISEACTLSRTLCPSVPAWCLASFPILPTLGHTTLFHCRIWFRFGKPLLVYFLKEESSGGNPVIPLFHSRGMVGGGLITLPKSNWPEHVVSFLCVSFCNARWWLLAGVLPSGLTHSTARVEDSCPFPFGFAALICLIWNDNLLSLSAFLFVEDHEQFRFQIILKNVADLTMCIPWWQLSQYLCLGFSLPLEKAVCPSLALNFWTLRHQDSSGS